MLSVDKQFCSEAASQLLGAANERHSLQLAARGHVQHPKCESVKEGNAGGVDGEIEGMGMADSGGNEAGTVTLDTTMGG